MKIPYSLEVKNKNIINLESIKTYNLKNETNESTVIHNLNYKYPYSGTVEVLPTGDRLFRILIKSDNAKKMSFKIINLEFKLGLYLHIYNENYNTILGPYSVEVNKLNELLTPEISGDKIVLEYYIPRRFCGCNAATRANLDIKSVTISYKNQNVSALSKANINLLKEGWNIISIINETFNNIDYSNSTIDENLIFKFDAKNKSYVHINGKNLEKDVGYWIFSKQNNGYINFN